MSIPLRAKLYSKELVLNVLSEAVNFCRFLLEVCGNSKLPKPDLDYLRDIVEIFDELYFHYYDSNFSYVSSLEVLGILLNYDEIRDIYVKVVMSDVLPHDTLRSLHLHFSKLQLAVRNLVKS